MPKTPRCYSCKEILPGRFEPGMMKQVTGWVSVRSQGGSNHVMDQEMTGEILCRSCGSLKRAGISIEQGSLFDADQV